MNTDLFEVFDKTDFGSNVHEVAAEGECRVLRLDDASGEGFMTVYRVFDGIYLMYNDFHLKSCISKYQNAETLLCIDHCREGRIEHENTLGRYYMEAGDLRIDRRVHHEGRVDLPLSHYHGITIGFMQDAAEQSLKAELPLLSVDLETLARTFCPDNKEFLLRTNEPLNLLFSQLYHAPKQIRLPYYKVKIAELLLMLSTIDPALHTEQRQYFPANQTDRIKEIHAIITGSLDKSFTVEALSAQSGIPPASLRKLFKAVYGATIYQYINIIDAKEMVRPEKLTKALNGGDIELRDVHFSYSETEVLHGISMTIRKGEFAALVGPSGSGKSTVARLIASLWDVSSGSISLGGVNICDIPSDDYNQKIAYVSQDNFLFDLSVRENIRLGNQNATDAEDEEAAKKCGCHEFITALENGYDTVVGTSGGHLSGGERQRIAIARAMLKNAEIIILDEATAYTDPENEALIQRSVAKLVKGKTLIVIAHRLSTVKNADRLYVIQDGIIAEQGTHEESCNSGRLVYADQSGRDSACSAAQRAGAQHDRRDLPGLCAADARPDYGRVYALINNSQRIHRRNAPDAHAAADHDSDVGHVPLFSDRSGRIRRDQYCNENARYPDRRKTCGKNL